MKIRLEASRRLAASHLGIVHEALVAATEDSEWFDSLSKEQQEDYIEDHPDSKFAKDHAAKEKEYNDGADPERISQIKSQMRMLIDDIGDMESSGDDATQERDQLQSLKEELQSLGG